MPRTRSVEELDCPVCIDNVKFGTETNCGHIFCGKFYFFEIYLEAMFMVKTKVVIIYYILYLSKNHLNMQ